jgi:hypothetical protein
MQTLRDFVLETLTHVHVGRLNFRYGATRVWPDGYRGDIAHCVRDGLIRVTTDRAVLGPDPELLDTPGGAFLMDTPRGQPHPMYFDSGSCDIVSGTAYVKRTLSVYEQADLRGCVVHEATHALQDWMRVRIDPCTAEGAAYLAGAITRRLWGYAIVLANPGVSGLSRSLAVADRFLAETDPHRRYVIPSADVTWLNARVTTGAASRYVYNGI